jgi:hypothetical protein
MYACAPCVRGGSSVEGLRGSQLTTQVQTCTLEHKAYIYGIHTGTVWLYVVLVYSVLYYRIRYTIY